MSYKRLPIIVYYEIDGKQRTFILTKHPFIANYVISLDEENVGQIILSGYTDWNVGFIEGHWLEGIDKQPFINAVVEAEKENPVLGT